MTSGVVIPAELVETMTDLHGAAGSRWIAGLPDAVGRVAARWRLTVGTPFPARYHWVAPARRADGADVVLKLGVTGESELVREPATLAAWNGHGAVRLLAAEPDDRGTAALLLSAARPGGDLTAAPDAKAFPVLAAVARRLHASGAARPDVVPDSGPRVAMLRAGHPLVAGELTSAAADVLERLMGTAAPPVLCHGDLHHANVLRDGQGWVAIDPHGVWGEPALDAGTALLNPPRPWAAVPDLGAAMDRRVGLLAEGLGVGDERVRGWGFVSAVVGAVWTAQDHARRDDDVLAVARALR